MRVRIFYKGRLKRGPKILPENLAREAEDFRPGSDGFLNWAGLANDRALMQGPG